MVKRFRTFLRLVADHDPDRKFANAFTRRLLHARSDAP